MIQSAVVNFNTDIGANLTDPMYQGIYHGSQKHQPDLDKVLERSWSNNLSKIIITAGNIEESKKALEIARTDDRNAIIAYEETAEREMQWLL